MPKQLRKYERFHNGLNQGFDPRDIGDGLSIAKNIMVDKVGKIRTMGKTSDLTSEISMHTVTHQFGYGLFAFQTDRKRKKVVIISAADKSGTLSLGNFLGDASTATNIGYISAIYSTFITVYMMLEDSNGFEDGDSLFYRSASTYGKTSFSSLSTTINGVPTETSEETGENWYAMFDEPDTEIDLWDDTTKVWRTGDIKLGDVSDGKPCFLLADGILRVSDGNFGSGNKNQWFGFINRTLFEKTGQSVSLNKLVSANQRIKPPNSAYFDPNDSNSPDESGDTYRTTPDSASSFVDNDTFIENTISDVYKVEVYLRTTTSGYPGDEGYEDSWHITVQCGRTTDSGTTRINPLVRSRHGAGPSNVRLTFIFPDPIDVSQSSTTAGIALQLSFSRDPDVSSISISSVKYFEGSGAIAEIAELDENSEVIGFNWTTDTGASNWNKDWEVGASYFYDEKQESSIALLMDIDNQVIQSMDKSSLGSTIVPSIIVYAKHGAAWNNRKTGMMLYIRKKNKGEWHPQVYVDFVKGIIKPYEGDDEIEGTYDSGNSRYEFHLKYDKILTPNLLDTYESVNGILESESSLYIGDDGEGYKTATIINRRIYVGNVRRANKDGKAITEGDAMYKSVPNKFDIFPLSYKVDAAIRDGDEIIKLESYGQRILQFKKQILYIINASGEFEYKEAEYPNRGIVYSGASMRIDRGVVWVNRHGVYLFDNEGMRDLLVKNGLRVINTDDWKSAVSDNAMIGYDPENRVLIIVSDYTNASSHGFVYDFITGSWTEVDSLFGMGMTNFTLDHKNRLVFADGSKITKWDNSAQDCDMEIAFKDDDFDNPGIIKKIYKIYVTYKKHDSGVLNNCFYYVLNGGTTFSNSSPEALLGSLSGSITDWDVAVFYFATPVECQSFRLKLDPASDSNIEINDISIEYRALPFKRVS